MLTTDKTPPIATHSSPEHRTVEFKNVQSFKCKFPERRVTAPPTAWLKTPEADKADRVDRTPVNWLLLDAAMPKIAPAALLLFPDADIEESCACTFFTDRQNASSKYAIPPMIKQL